MSPYFTAEAQGRGGSQVEIVDFRWVIEGTPLQTDERLTKINFRAKSDSPLCEPLCPGAFVAMHLIPTAKA
jgi:hypothetical protein